MNGTTMIVIGVLFSSEFVVRALIAMFGRYYGYSPDYYGDASFHFVMSGVGLGFLVAALCLKLSEKSR